MTYYFWLMNIIVRLNADACIPPPDLLPPSTREAGEWQNIPKQLVPKGNY